MAETALELSRKAAALLQERGVENGRLDAELLLAAALGIDRLQLYLQHDRPVSEPELEQFRGFVRRRLQREPVQYILGDAAFRDLTLVVDRRVLIPRPETELLVDEVLRWVQGRSGRLSVLDVGTGSGAIALALASEGPFERVVASDISTDALAVAQANAVRSGLGGRIEFREGEGLGAVAAGERFTVIVANPPYVAASERAALPADVRDYEPASALFAGADGLDVVRSLVSGGPSRLEAGGLLALEIGETQAEAVCELVRAEGSAWQVPRVVQDLTGRDRMILVEAAAGRGADAGR